jgi:hypothetical protein
MSGGSDVSPRHKIDAIRTLDGMAANGPAGVPAADRFQITINLGDTSLKFDKSVKPDPFDIDPFNDVDDDTNIATPWGLIATAKKQSDDGNGNAL